MGLISSAACRVTMLSYSPATPADEDVGFRDAEAATAAGGHRARPAKEQ